MGFLKSQYRFFTGCCQLKDRTRLFTEWRWSRRVLGLRTRSHSWYKTCLLSLLLAYPKDDDEFSTMGNPEI